MASRGKEESGYAKKLDEWEQDLRKAREQVKFFLKEFLFKWCIIVCVHVYL